MKGTDTVPGFLAPRLKPLVGTQVDTIFLDVIGGDAPLYDSKVQPVYGVAQGLGALPNLKTLIDAGHCPLRIVTDFAHQNGMEAFTSIMPHCVAHFHCRTDSEYVPNRVESSEVCSGIQMS